MTERPIPSQFRHGGSDEARERELGLRLVTRLHGLLRAARIYDESNQTYRHQLSEMLAALAEATDEETVLIGMGDSFYMNGVRLRAQASQMGLFRALQEEFQSRGIGALRFMRGLAGDELTAFLRLFTAARTPEQGERLPEAATEAGILRVLPVRARDLRAQEQQTSDADSEEARDERTRARQMFQRTVLGTRSILIKAARTGKPALAQTRRLLQPIVESIVKEEFSIVGLTALKEHDEYTYVHCVNVSIVSIAMGQALGLSRAALANLGVASLLHDLGKIAVPAEILNKPGKLTPEEWTQVKRHPLEGLKMVTRVLGLTNLTLDAMRVNFEHHMNVDGTGYPTVARPRRLSALARIVSVADCFDALTGHRAYRSRPFTGYEALEQLTGPERSHFDAGALWALVRSVSLYPAGCVLLTESGHVVLSLSPNPSDLRRPFCRVLERPDGTRLHGESAETWDPMPPSERVARVLKPEDYPVQTDEQLAA